MLKHIKALLKGKVFIIAFIVTAGILTLSLIRMPKYDITISSLDKWQHFFAYFILSISWLFAFFKENRKYPIVFCCILFGIIIEVLQHTIINYREGDYLDIMANTLGVLLGLLVFNQVLKKNRLKNKKTCN